MRLLLFIVTVAISGLLQAQEIRIGYVDMKRLLDNAPQVMAGREALDLEFRPLNDQLMTDEETLLRLEQELAAASGSVKSATCGARSSVAARTWPTT